MEVTEAGPYVRTQDGGYKTNFNLGSSSSGKFQLSGGKYLLEGVATGSGTITLQKVGPDGSTLITVGTALSATATSVVIDLPPGQYQITVATFTAVFASISSIPY